MGAVFFDLLTSSRRGVVLCYHLVGAGLGGPVDLDVDVFEQHLALLQAHNVRPLADVVATGQGVALTFDDAFANFHDVVWPRLRAAALPATLFVPTGFVDGTEPSPLSTGPHLRPCSWQQLRAMRDAGLDIGSHSHRHHNLRRLDDDAIDADLGLAAARLQAELGVRASAFCYPQAKYNDRAEAVVRRHHAIAVVGGGRRVDVRRPWRTSRTSVVRGGPSLQRILRWPIEPREWLADKVRQWR
jgi:peptidoglycan/xylan/chitin deacetylase (PgdA/CDA1 family)